MASGNVLTHEQFGKALTRFAQAVKRGDAGLAIATRSTLLFHDKALRQDAEEGRPDGDKN